MEDSNHVTGQCLCGAVALSAVARSLDVTACHCAMCRRWSAGPFMEITCQSVSFEGTENIGRIRSSAWAERGFCKQCGSNLFYQIVGSSEYQVSVGLLDDQSNLTIALQVYIDCKPPFYAFTQTSDTMTEAQVIAKYAPDFD